MAVIDEHDPKYVEIEKQLRAVIASLDDDFLRQIVDADWDNKSVPSHWYNAVVQMLFAIVESHGVKIDELFADWGVEPHNVWLLPEYKHRESAGVYEGHVIPYDGMIHRK